MSDDSDAESFQELKRKMRVLGDSSSPSSSSGDSSIENFTRRVSSARNPLQDSSSDSESGSSCIVVSKRKRPLRVTSDSDSDSTGSVIGRRSKRLARLSSDSDSDSSGSLIVCRPRRPGHISSDSSNSDSDDASDGGFQSQWETDFRDSEPESTKHDAANKLPVPETNIDSDSSDGESDKCPICLLSFKQQEIGTPETCDHIFCLECLQEWSKNMNTCPVDRREYNLILVKKHVHGKVINQIQVEKPQPQNEINIIEDPTSCEICGSFDFEDRMLLCDGCDLGFHLFCLTPPLEEVPNGAWFCNDCSPDDVVNQEITLQEVQLLLDDVDDVDYEPLTRRLRRNSTRLVPRTGQSERVRRRIDTNRINQLREMPSTSSEVDEPTTSIRSRVTSTTTTRRTKKKKTKKKRTVRYRTVYKIDEATGETIAVKERCKKRRKERRRRRQRRSRAQRPTLRPKTVKKRLAVQLGICAPTKVPQNLPDVKIPTVRNSIGLMREQAGIPALHLFGQSNQLDYFSDEDDYHMDGSDVMIRRAPNRSDVTAMRRMARRKAAILAPSTVSSSNDILGSILDSQETFHSKSTLFSVDENGRLKMEKRSSNNNNYVNVNRESSAIRQRPTSYTNNGTGSSSNNYRSDSNNTGGEYRGNAQDQHSTPTSTMESESRNYDSNLYGGVGGQEENTPQDYTQRMLSGNYDASSSENEKNKQKDTGSNTPNSESEIDIYSDIETVSTSKMDEGESEMKAPSPLQQNIEMPTGDDEEAANDSESEMVIDTEKDLEKYSEENSKEEAAVTSTVDSNSECAPEKSTSYSNKASEIQSGAIQSSNQVDDVVKNDFVDEKDHYDNEDSEDGCPNFSIYSKESQNLAQDTECLPGTSESKPKHQDDIPMERLIYTNPEPGPYNFEQLEEQPDFYMPEPVQLEPEAEENDIFEKKPCEKNQDNPSDQKKKSKNNKVSSGGLYSDSEDETIVRKHSYGATDLNKMTEDIISEEERSYTPCLDEKKEEGIEGLDTEMISDEERNDFDESHERKTASDGGDALEINAKECELDFTRPEDYEEGEIVDKLKMAKKADKETAAESSKADDDDDFSKKSKKKDKGNTEGNKENEAQNKESSFKKLSKSNRERHYRDKDRSRSRDKKSEKRDRELEGRKEKIRRSKKKERRREIERYDVRALIADKPRKQKDQFGRDIRSPTRSRSRSLTPPPRRSISRTRRSPTPKKSGRRSRVRTRSPPRRRSTSKNKKRKRSPNRSRKSRKSRERVKSKKKVSRARSKTPPIRNRLWNQSPPPKEWTPSFSRSPSPHASPSWTPPKTLEPSVKQHNLKVILANDAGKKRKDKKRKDGDRRKEDRSRKRRFDKTPPPSKEVFASGENILVSVSFNKENETRDISTRDKRRKASTDEPQKKKKKTKNRNNKKDLSGVKPVAIIDLDRSPFQVITSPKDVIVLSDSDNAETDNRGIQTNICDSSQLVASPERSVSSYAMGPKTPPEPQVKFSLTAKQPTVRAIINPLHEAEEENEPNQESSENLYKGPNTPPISPPSSPDAYDPFEPTKSRSVSPEPLLINQSKDESNTAEGRNNSDEKQAHTPDVLKPMTPPVAEIQPADSQSGAQELKSPERIAVVINQVLQSINSTSTKPVAQTVPFSSVPTSHNNSAPATNSTAPRINIINSTIVQPSSIPQRIVLPNVQKSSPVKIPPTKSIKPMPSKSSKGRKRQNGIDEVLDLDSPYSPGSSDYEDLFEPPPDIITKIIKSKKPTTTAKTKNTFDALFGSPSYNVKKNKNEKIKKVQITPTKGKQAGLKLDEDNLKILDDLPNSAVEMQVKDKYLKKLNRQERVVEEVKLVLKPHYNKKRINKDEYKDVLRRAVPKICHNKSGEINPTKIKHLVEAYVKKLRHSKKVTSSVL